MTVGVGYTKLGYVCVQDLDGDGACLLTVEAALNAAAAFETHAADPFVAARGRGTLELTSKGVSIFKYAGTPDRFADLAALLRESARSAAECGAAGHA